jgi:nucleotide-binding universal stress UspA family protein
MKTIIAAVDFSDASVNAAAYAADMALAIDARLLLFHVYAVPVTYTEIPVAFTEADMLQESTDRLNEIAKDLTQKSYGRIIIDTEVRIGFFFGELKAVCERVKPYAVVMGSQGTTAIERFLLGGHTVYAMKNLNWPLITVPSYRKFSSIKKIGLACDFNDAVYTTPVEEIKTLVSDFKAELHLLNTDKAGNFDPDQIFEAGQIGEMLGALKPEFHFIANENIDEGIMDFAERNDIDLLVVLPKRHGLIDMLIHRSHTKQFVLHSHIPVLALHAPSI